MSDFDLILIKEYEKRHGLYDQNSPYYKDKLYSENAWREISMQLNCNVPMLKCRMIQLRCRYNNEKRKHDQVRKKHPNAVVTWPLFNHLKFLNEHIKARKRYKTSINPYDDMAMMEQRQLINPVAKRRGRPPKNFSYAELADDNDIVNNQYEKDADMKSESSEGADDDLINSANFLAQPVYTNPDSATDANNTFNSIPNGHNDTTVRATVHKEQHLSKKFNQSNRFSEQPSIAYDHSNRAPDKFTAFGQFVTASLADMSEDKALSLIESFTISLVKTLNEKTAEN